MQQEETPPLQPFPVYLLAIPPEKRRKAQQLYTYWLLEKRLADSPSTSRSNADRPYKENYASVAELTSIFTVSGHNVETGKKKTPLSAEAKARAALIRYLGACEPCRRRRIQVSSSGLWFLQVINLSFLN